MMMALMLALQLSMGMAASPVIGVVTAKGSFRLDNAATKGNGTLFEGSSIETGQNSGQLQLTGGVQMQLGADTKGKVYRDRLVLERGSGEIRNASRFGVEASTLRVVSDDHNAVTRIEVREPHRIQVAAMRGNLRVVNSNGILIAALAAGRALEFETKGAGASAPTTLSGCLTKTDGHYYLTDDVSGVTVELKGSSLDKYIGYKIEVTGGHVPTAKPAGNATQVIQVSNLKEISKRCSSGAAAAAAGGAAAGGAAAGGAAAGGTAAGAAAGTAVATKAVIAGVVVAAAATTTAVAVTTDEDNISK